MHTKTSPADIIEKCKIALKLYATTDYKKDFGFIDFVSLVRQRDLTTKLDAIVFHELAELVQGGNLICILLFRISSVRTKVSRLAILASA